MHYVPALDGIRALAVLLVLFFHAKVPGFGAGFFGVDVFFVLSGYLITQILVAERERTGRIDLPRFYVRRLRRLWPALLSLLAVYLAVFPWLFPNDTRAGALLAAVYVGNYADLWGVDLGALSHTWSLALEEQFYLAWPLLLLGLLRLPRPWALASVAALFAGLTLWRWHLAGEIGWGVYHRFDTHSAGLALGCLAGLARVRLSGRYFWVGVAGLALALHQFTWDDYAAATRGFLLAEVSAVLVILAPPAWLGTPVLAWLGRLSYGIYLWHYPIVRVCRDLELGWGMTLAASTVGGVAFAALSYYTLEAVFRARRSEPLAVSTAPS